MSRKNKEPKAPKMPKEKKPATPFDEDIKKGIAIGLAIVLLFSAGNIVGGLTSNKAPEAPAATTAAPAPETTVAPETTPAAPVTEAPTAAPATTATADTTAANADTSAPAADTTAADTTAAGAPSTGAPQTTAEIVEYFNTAANKIKTEASKVTRNYEDLQHNEEKLVMPSALQAIGSPLISQFLKKDETPVDYTGGDIQANFPVKGQTFVSNTTEADLKSATCTDEGAEYKITLNYVDAVDPTNTSVANAFNIINPQDVYDNASVVQNFSAQYYDATIECKVDKASGHITWINYSLPIVLSVTAKVLVTLDAQVGMTFIDDYTITY